MEDFLAYRRCNSVLSGVLPLDFASFESELASKSACFVASANVVVCLRSR